MVTPRGGDEDDASTGESEPRDPEFGFPPPGAVLHRLRSHRGWSLRDVAKRTGISQSFLGSLERRESDITLERLARLAKAFDHDVGSFLGYSTRRSEPTMLDDQARLRINRGEGIEYEVIRLVGLGFELVRVALDPHSRFSGELAHEGVDVTLVISGTVTARYNNRDYVLPAGSCVMWSAGYAHSFRNDTDSSAVYVGFVTAQVF
jgi:transcriptional regulator with XRE-family HTH domain